MPDPRLEALRRTQVAYTTLANLIANLAGTPVDEAFAAQAWEPAQAWALSRI